MTNSTIAFQNDSVITEIEIAAPPERVFNALIDPAQLTRWFTNPGCPTKLWEMDAKAGGRYRYVTEEGSTKVNEVSQFECHGEILEIDPPRLLAYSWIANWHENKSLRTIVRWELSGSAAGTRVRVTHSGLAPEPAAHKDYSGGWTGALQMLKEFMET